MKLLFVTALLGCLAAPFVRSECLDTMEILVDDETIMAKKLSFAGYDPTVKRYVRPICMFECASKLPMFS